MTNFTFDEGQAASSITSTKTLPSIYDQLRSEFSKPSATIKEVILKVTARPSMSVRFSTNIDLDQLDRWRAASRKNRKSDAIDVREFNSLVILSQCTGILLNGTLAEDAGGDPLTFRSVEFVEALGALDSKGAIKTLYEKDAYILNTGTEILEAAGWGDEDQDEEDPLD